VEAKSVTRLWRYGAPLNGGRVPADTGKVEAAGHPRNQWPALGTLLVRDGAVSEEQLERALALQRLQPDQRLGEILLAEGFVTPRDISRVLAEQHELEFVDLNPASIDTAAALLLTAALARRYRALPIRFLDDGSILIAVADPTNVMFSDELRLALGMPVRICVAAPDAIEEAIARVIDGDENPIEEILPDDSDVHDDASILDLHADSPAVVFANRAISSALDAGASDIHFTPQQKGLFVRIRVDGVMRELSSIRRAHASAVASRVRSWPGSTSPSAGLRRTAAWRSSEVTRRSTYAWRRSRPPTARR
jgi:type IV pilus assembly protein PilB